ncbi:hypothetical protein [Natrinema sp. SYSU A 869]|uniref:hypothetical protein n=1 Tax=Natrinema sp. SYSU A 869 TaxID=2871694 RepID=UPI001CA39925|nr:hypothetical protein [Natrinema sp. SYSU A 869]
MVSPQDPQDDLLIVEVLIYYGHEFEDTNSNRATQAWQLAADLAGEHELTLLEHSPQ